MSDMYADMIRILGELPPPPRFTEIKLTQEQIDELPKAGPDPVYGALPPIFDIPIIKVEHYADSTPFQLKLEQLREELRHDLGMWF